MMEIRIRTGEGIRCEYTGEMSQVLVRLVAETDSRLTNDSDMDRDSGWMGRKALEDALKILNSVEGRPLAVDVARTALLPGGTHVEMLAPMSMVPDSKPQVDAFAREIANLAANPPKTRDNEKEGLSESHVREVMKRFLPTFRNPVASMYPALQEYVGMPKERFLTLVETLKHG